MTARYQSPIWRGLSVWPGLIAGVSLLLNDGAYGAIQKRLVPITHGTIEYLLDGDGPVVVMIPSFGRGAEDFEALAAAIVRAGYRVARPQSINPVSCAPSSCWPLAA